MRLNQIGDRGAAVKLLVAGILGLAIAIGLFTPLPGQSDPKPTHSQIPTLDVRNG